MELHRHACLELIEEGLLAGGTLRARVAGESMSPFLRPGNWIIAERVGGESLARGDLVLFARGSDLVVHRYLGTVRREGRLLHLSKGDGRFFFDAPWPSSVVVGRVLEVHKGSRILRLRRGPWRTVNYLLGAFSALEGLLFRATRPLCGKGACDGCSVACDR
jgi:hypothetical protein